MGTSEPLIAQDVPRWLIDAFTHIDYAKLTLFVRPVFMQQMKAFCAKYPQKTQNYAANIIRTNIPQDVLAILNLIDYTRIDPEQLDMMRTQIPQYLQEHLSWAMK